jgi:hypothetical protein
MQTSTVFSYFSQNKAIKRLFYKTTPMLSNYSKQQLQYEVPINKK